MKIGLAYVAALQLLVFPKVGLCRLICTHRP
jgi:hypothetical protein